jgi:acyl-CoA synthetase (NDP forming)
MQKRLRRKPVIMLKVGDRIGAASASHTASLPAPPTLPSRSHSVAAQSLQELVDVVAARRPALPGARRVGHQRSGGISVIAADASARSVSSCPKCRRDAAN